MLNMPVGDIKKKIQEQAGLSSQEVEQKVQQKMQQLSGLISEEGACHIVANELSVKLLPAPEERKIKDLLPGMREVTQDMRVVQVYEMRTFESKFGGEGKVASMLGGDETGVVRVTAWGDKADVVAKLEPGAIIRAKNGYVKDNQGRAELHLNNNSEIEVAPEGVEIAAPSRGGGENAEYVRKKIADITQGDYRVELLGTIVQVYDPRFFERKDGTRGLVANMLLDDGTGSVRCACWDEKAGMLLGGKSLEDLQAQEGAGYEEEKTAALGHIVKVTGRAKLNTVYNNIELSVDSLDMSPDAQEELERLQAVSGAAKPETAPAATQEQASQDAVEVSEQVEEDVEQEQEAQEEKKAAPVNDDAVSLDDLDDIDVDDIDLDEFDDL